MLRKAMNWSLVSVEGRPRVAKVCLSAAGRRPFRSLVCLWANVRQRGGTSFLQEWEVALQERGARDPYRRAASLSSHRLLQQKLGRVALFYLKGGDNPISGNVISFTI